MAVRAIGESPSRQRERLSHGTIGVGIDAHELASRDGHSMRMRRPELDAHAKEVAFRVMAGGGVDHDSARGHCDRGFLEMLGLAFDRESQRFGRVHVSEHDLGGDVHRDLRDRS
jgi:hypothetical protein